jgi:hypothetical protein
MAAESAALAATRNTLNRLYAWRDHHETSAAQIVAAKDRSRTAAEDLLWHASSRDHLSTIIAELIAVVKLMEA